MPHFSSLAPYFIYGAWHYYYRHYFGVFLLCLSVNLALCVALYALGSGKYFALFVLAIWFEEKILLLFASYWLLAPILKTVLLEETQIKLVILGRDFSSTVQRYFESAMQKTFEVLDAQAWAFLYEHLPFIALAVLGNRLIANLIIRHKLGLRLEPSPTAQEAV